MINHCNLKYLKVFMFIIQPNKINNNNTPLKENILNQKLTNIKVEVLKYNNKFIITFSNDHFYLILSSL